MRCSGDQPSCGMCRLTVPLLSVADLLSSRSGLLALPRGLQLRREARRKETCFVGCFSHFACSSARADPLVHSKAYVASLEERVRHLEAILDSHGLSQTAAANGTIPAPAPAARAVAEDEELHHVAIESLRVRRPALSCCTAADGLLEPLQIDELGEFTSFGHSSVFMHLPGPHGRSSAQNVGPQALPAGSASPTARPATSFLCPGPEPHPSATSSSPAIAEGDDSAMSSAGDLNWAKNLPEVKGMDEQLHAVLLDLFFAYYNS